MNIKNIISNIFNYIKIYINKIMSQVSINKYNNQYLKCIVTKYKSSVKLLSNSGSLIILKPNDNVDRSYIYLGDTFLASGYGFEKEEDLLTSEKIVKEYDSTINELKETDQSLIEVISNNYNDLLNKLNDYVKIGTGTNNENNWGGNISNTYVNLNGVNVPIINIIQHGRDAIYDDIEIKKITKTVITENNEYNTESSILNIPIGTVIKKIKISIEYDPHDSGGINKMIVKYASNDDISKSVYVQYDGNAPVQLSNTSTFRKDFILDLTQNNNAAIQGYVVKDKDLNVISNLSLVISGSQTYKVYPDLKELYNVDIISTNNVIREHEIENLTSLSIHPITYIKYYVNYNNGNDNISLDNFNSNNGLEDSESIIYDIINIDNAAKRIVIAVPSIFKVLNISYIPNSSDKYFGNEEYNWSGSSIIVPNIKMQYQSLNVVCNLYDITIQSNSNPNNELNSGNIKLTLLNTHNNIDLRSETTSEYILNGKRFVNEYFDNIYWVQDINADNKLQEIYRNGLTINKTNQ